MRGSIHAGTAGSPGLAWHLGPDIDYLLRQPKGGGGLLGGRKIWQKSWLHGIHARQCESDPTPNASS